LRKEQIMLNEIHNTMKAIRIHTHGNPEVLVYEDAPRPIPSVGEVLIHVYAAGVNPADWKTRAAPGRLAPAAFPAILGWDVSGVIETVGPGVTDFGEDDAVYGMIRFPKPGAAYAEYTTAPITDIARKPTTIDHVHAAAVPLAALTAWQALFEQAHLTEGQTILIAGAAGGVGHFAVQLAKAKGAHVIGTASPRNADFLRGIGVDQVIDYTTTPLEKAAQGVDVVFDTVGGETRERSIDVLKRGGVLVSTVFGRPSEEHVAAAGVQARGLLVHPSSDQLAEIARSIDEGRVRPVVDTVFALADTRKAHELSEGGHVRGKVVLRVVE
jgi:NADPH:quinone reductase-like Zn-dependent oxidoreductase